tara:strand:+ start:34 stop:789 length:756 start_codon:yes stop_codon:yes gene_type:complete
MITDIYLTVRLKSTRLKNKALAKVENQSIIEHIIDRARHVKKATNIVLCTSINPEDDSLEFIANKKGIPCFRGSEDNIIKRFIGASKLFGPDLCIRITGDNCLFSPEFIDEAIQKHIDGSVDYTSTKELAGGSKGDIFSFSALQKVDKLLQDDKASEYLSWLFADEKHFKVQWLEVKKSLKRPQYRLHCDTPEDLKFIRTVYAHLYDGKNIISYEKLINFLDKNPEIVKINKSIKQISKDEVVNKINFTLK